MTDLTQVGTLLTRTRRYLKNPHAFPDNTGYALMRELHDRIVELTPPASHSGYTQLEWNQMIQLERHALILASIHKWSESALMGAAPVPSLLVELAEFIYHTDFERHDYEGKLDERYAELRKILCEKTEDVHWE